MPLLKPNKESEQLSQNYSKWCICITWNNTVLL